MSLPAAKLRPFAGGPHATAGIVLSTADLLGQLGDGRLLTPVFEPASNGEPPVPPILCRQLSAGRRGRFVRCRSGQMVTSSQSTKSRGRLTVEWAALDRDEHDALRAFFGAAGTAGELLSFDVRPDGPDGETTRVRLLAPIVHEWIDRGADGRGVYRIPPTEVEEIFA